MRVFAAAKAGSAGCAAAAHAAGAGDEGVDELGELGSTRELDRNHLDAGVKAFDIQEFKHFIQLGDVRARICYDNGVRLLIRNDARIGRHETAEGARHFFGVDVLEREDTRDQRVGVG
jgi:hypothetical protein